MSRARGGLDGPSKQYTLIVTDAAVSEIQLGGAALNSRKVITIQSEEGKFRVFFGNGDSTPSVSDVQTDGLLQWKWTKESYEAADSQDVFLISESGTINIHVVERA